LVILPNISILAERAERLMGRLSECDICPRHCRVNRKTGAQGFCRVGGGVPVASMGPHFGEEAPLVGSNGSGTVFFSGCNLMCAFCQNYGISHQGEGNEVSAERLAGIFLSIQRMGCHNLNLVTPTHVTPQIMEALFLAVSRLFGKWQGRWAPFPSTDRESLPVGFSYATLLCPGGSRRPAR
jgi:putative pyruvate formate lyase activating enzyme